MKLQLGKHTSGEYPLTAQTAILGLTFASGAWAGATIKGPGDSSLIVGAGLRTG